MNRATELSIAFLEAQPVGAARVLDQLSADDAAAFLSDVPESMAAGVLAHMQFARAATILQRSTPKRAAALLLRMSANARSVVLRALTDENKEAVLAALTRRERAAMRRYLAYPPGTVGAWMDAPKATFAPDTNVGDCLKRVRQLGERLGTLVFVVDAERRLRGCVDIDELLSASDNALLEDVMRRDIVTLSPQASLTIIVSLPAWDRSLSLPVIDRRRRLVGNLHFDSLREGLVVDRGPTSGLQINVMIIHLFEAFLVSLSGLISTATAQTAMTRIANGRET